MTWLQRIVKARSDLSTNPGGDGGSHGGGGSGISPGSEHPGQAQIFSVPEGSKNNVRKKKRTRQYNRRGLEDADKMP